MRVKSITYRVQYMPPGGTRWYDLRGTNNNLNVAKKCVADCQTGVSSVLRGNQYRIIEVTTTRRVLP